MDFTVKNVSKRFGPTVAVDNVSVRFAAGEIRAIVGENGAGKSTLLKIVSGIHKRDSGEVYLDDKPFNPENYVQAATEGVAYVFQETTINPYLGIAENIFINRLREFRTPLGLINRKKLNSAAQKILDDIGVDFKATDPIQSLNLGQWKTIEVARGLAYDPKVIFFDESTAFLNYNEVKAFLNIVKRLKERGMAIGIVTHHMNEIFELADTATVMKDGRWVADKKIKDITQDEIQQLMVGRKLSAIYPDKKEVLSDEITMKVEGLSCGDQLKDVTFELHKGEILGIGGLKGAGGDELLSIIYGDEKETAGKIWVENTEYAHKNPHDAMKNGFSMLPGERTIEGLITTFSIKDNINMGAMKKKGILTDQAKETKVANEMIQKVTIKTDSCEMPCDSLSGGNMQKVVIAKCLATNPKILLLNNPTRGIDVGARLEIYTVISELAKEGMSILMLSEDLGELIGVSDRTMILRRGEISKMYEFDETPTEESMITYML